MTPGTAVSAGTASLSRLKCVVRNLNVTVAVGVGGGGGASSDGENRDNTRCRMF